VRRKKIKKRFYIYAPYLIRVSRSPVFCGRSQISAPFSRLLKEAAEETKSSYFVSKILGHSSDPVTRKNFV